MKLVLRRAAVLLPYLAVSLGFYLAKSVWLAMLGYHAGMAVLLLWAQAGPNRRDFRVPVDSRWVLPLMVCGLLAGVGLYLAWPWLGVDPSLGARLAELGLSARLWLPFILYFSLVNPWLEEAYWRGWLGSVARRPQAGDAWFSGYHLLILAPFIPWPWWGPMFVVLGAAGWFWRQVVRRDASLLSPALFHLAADASIVVAIYLRVKS